MRYLLTVKQPARRGAGDMPCDLLAHRGSTSGRTEEPREWRHSPAKSGHLDHVFEALHPEPAWSWRSGHGLCGQKQAFWEAVGGAAFKAGPSVSDKQLELHTGGWGGGGASLF